MNCIESYISRCRWHTIQTPPSTSLRSGIFSSFLTPYGDASTPPSDLDFPINTSLNRSQKELSPIFFPSSFATVHGLAQALSYPDTHAWEYSLHGVATRSDRFYISSNAIFDSDHTPLFLIVINITHPCIKFFFHPRVINHSSFITRALYFQFLPLLTNININKWGIFSSYAHTIQSFDRQIVIADTSRFILSVRHSSPYQMFNYDFNSLVLKHLSSSNVVQ